MIPPWQSVEKRMMQCDLECDVFYGMQNGLIRRGWVCFENKCSSLKLIIIVCFLAMTTRWMWEINTWLNLNPKQEPTPHPSLRGGDEWWIYKRMIPPWQSVKQRRIGCVLEKGNVWVRSSNCLNRRNGHLTSTKTLQGCPAHRADSSNAWRRYYTLRKFYFTRRFYGMMQTWSRFQPCLWAGYEPVSVCSRYDVFWLIEF